MLPKAILGPACKSSICCMSCKTPWSCLGITSSEIFCTKYGRNCWVLLKKWRWFGVARTPPPMRKTSFKRILLCRFLVQHRFSTRRFKWLPPCQPPSVIWAWVRISYSNNPMINTKHIHSHLWSHKPQILTHGHLCLIPIEVFAAPLWCSSFVVSFLALLCCSCAKNCVRTWRCLARKRDMEKSLGEAGWTNN